MSLKRKNSNKLSSFIGLTKLLSIIMIGALLLATFTACRSEDPPTNEELIEQRIKTFLNAYNSGDMDAVLDCLDAKSRNAFQAMLNLIGGIAGSYLDFDINLADLFSLGVHTKPGDFMKLEIISINILNNESAIATTTMQLSNVTMDIYFDMVYENDGWYIHDMTDKKPADSNNGSNETDENALSVTDLGTYSYGRASISYTENGVTYYGILNIEGEIIYTTDKRVKFVTIGDGTTVVNEYNQTNSKYYVSNIVDRNGNIVAMPEADLEMLSYGDGLALVYKRKESISKIEHLYGVIDFSGKWVQSLTDLKYYPKSKSAGYSHFYMGDKMFAIMVQTWGGNTADFIFLNSETGDMFYLSHVADELSPFINGVTFVRDVDGIINPYNGDESNMIDTPKNILLHSDGMYEEYAMDGKDYKGYSKGYIWYTVDGEENNVYIEDITSSDNGIFIYDEYSASKIYSIDFDGEYGLVYIKGANSKRYFTMIDKNGNQQFEPIELGINSDLGGYTASFSEETVLYQNSDRKYCIANKNGDVIVTDYAYVGKFSNNVAVACIGERVFDDNAVWIYINKNNEPIKESFAKP